MALSTRSGGHTGPASLRIGLIEQQPHVGEVFVDEFLDCPQWMIGANPSFDSQGAKHVQLTILLSTHRGLRVRLRPHHSTIHVNVLSYPTFAATC